MEEKAFSQIILGSGCFWCTEAIFQGMPGVISVVPGYTGGHVPHPSYEQVCQQTTGHAEACQILYDPAQVSLNDLLDVFWRCHDPTSLDRQGNDIGPPYRSIISYNVPEDARRIQVAVQKAQAQFSQPIVTQVQALDVFYPAEPEHHNYYNKHPNAAYCQRVIAPKLKKI